jgi:hypothetical protein
MWVTASLAVNIHNRPSGHDAELAMPAPKFVRIAAFDVVAVLATALALQVVLALRIEAAHPLVVQLSRQSSLTVEVPRDIMRAVKHRSVGHDQGHRGPPESVASF